MLEYDKMRVTDLKKICKEKGLALSGTKSELIERLQAFAVDDDADDDLLNDDEGLGDATVDDEDDEVELKDVTPTKETLPTPPLAEPAKVTTEIEAPVTETSENSEPTKPENSESIVKISEPLSEAQRLEKRAERFGATSVESKKTLRAQRFGGGGATTTTTTTKSDVLGSASQAVSAEKLKQRAERFGTVTSSTGTADTVDSQEKLQKRKMRFGAITAGSLTADLSSAEAKKKRADRFGVST